VEPTSSPDTSKTLQGENSAVQAELPKIVIRGSVSSASRAAQKCLERADLIEIIQGLGVGPTASLVIDCKKSAEDVLVESKKDSLYFSIPARGYGEQQMTKAVARALIGFAITQTAIEAVEKFAACGVECPVRSAKLGQLFKQFSAFEDNAGQGRAGLLSKALAPHRDELVRRTKNLLDKLRTPASLLIDGLSAGNEAFCQKMDAFRGISELLGNTVGLQDTITQRFKERLVVLEDLFAKGVFHGDHAAGQAVVDAMESLRQRVLTSGWFKRLPRMLQPAQLGTQDLQPQRALLNASFWADAGNPTSISAHQTSQPTHRDPVSTGLANMVAGLRHALAVDIEFRQIPFKPESGFDLLEGLIAVSPSIPTAIASLDGEISAEQLADLDEFLRILLQIRYCPQPTTKNFYEYVVYGIVPDGSVRPEELERGDLAIRPHHQLLQCIALIATSEPGIAGERVSVFKEELMLMATRAIAAVMYQYRACLALHLKTGALFDQHSIKVVISDLEAMEEAIQVVLNHPLEGKQSFGFSELLQAMQAVRESYSKSALLALSDDELAARVEEVLTLDHSGPYADQLHEISERLTERMRAYLGTKAEGVHAQLESLSRGETIIPIVQYAKEMLTIVRTDPNSEASATLKKSIGETLLDMLRVLEDYYSTEIALTSRPGATVEDVYRTLDAMHHLMLEASYVRDELRPYAEYLPDLLLSKSQVLVEQFPKKIRRDLIAAPALLGEVVQSLARDVSAPENSVKKRIKSCIEGLRWARLPRGILQGPARDSFDSLLGRRATGLDFN
jgi:hypothetical protein